MTSNTLSTDSALQHNNDIIDSLDANDFVYLEKDLDYYEKVCLDE